LTAEIVCILPCNGLDKSLGVIAREVSLQVIEKKSDVQLICPVLLNNGDERYETLIQTAKIIIINGCMTRCPTKLIEKRNLKPFKQILIPDMFKKYKVKSAKTLILNEENIKLAELIADEIITDLNKSNQEKDNAIREFQEQEFFDITVDKYYFTVPKDGYFFNENDCWIKPERNTALLGITDYLQNAAADILFVDLPELGCKIEQFGDIGSFESSKKILQLISPVSGKIIAVNKSLEQNPEYLNQDPYRKGWFVEIELDNFEEDKELLMNGSEYFDYMKNKIMKEKNHLDQINDERDV